ncbi:outer membrane lipoprotein carrier protein LolA [Halobacteriovorax sp. HLS]|uniref:LolA family protein n=1 Tax=Halobacteriovorax sp. HLS TaxID=2234000 RepID=UPI000FDA9603|nr:outer membrane lipoprotein carrier protein LolA [Halobacteriovorax sp. HLS]
MKILITSFFLISLNIQATSFVPDTFSAKFQQVYKSALTGKEKRSSGSLDYSYPGSIRLETQSPESLIYVSNNKTTWYYTPPFIEGEAGQVSIQQSSKNGLTKFLDMLRKGLKSNKYYTIKKDKLTYKVSFSKNAQKDLGIIFANLHFSKNDFLFEQLTKIEMTQTDKKVKNLILSNIDKSPKFLKTHFDFKIPKNTKVNR